MKLPRRSFLRLTAGAATLPAVSRIAGAQAYPTRPARIIVGFPAGGVGRRNKTPRRRPVFRLRTQMRDATLVRDLRHPRNVMTSPAPSPSDDLNGLRVLVVEDSWQVSAGLKLLLKSWGARVIGPVPTTAEAMLLLSQETPDVALVDVALRNDELSHDLIDWLHDRGVRVVVLTGYGDVASTIGKAAAVLQKPVKEELLITSLRR
jgi:CheY-like chemotaxis protein